MVISQKFSVCLTRPKLYKVTKSWCNMVPPSKMSQNFMYDHTTDAIAYHSYPRQPLTDGGRCRRYRPPTSSTPARRQMDSKWNSTKKIQEENVQFHATHIVHYISLLEVDMPWLCHFFEPSLALGLGLCSCAQPPSKIVLSSLQRKAAITSGYEKWGCCPCVSYWLKPNLFMKKMSTMYVVDLLVDISIVLIWIQVPTKQNNWEVNL